MYITHVHPYITHAYSGAQACIKGPEMLEQCVSQELTWRSLQHLEEAMHESNLLGIKSIGSMLGFVALLCRCICTLHHLQLHVSTPWFECVLNA